MVNDYRQVREDGSEFLGHGVFLVGHGSADSDDRAVSWWLFDSYALPPVAGHRGLAGRVSWF